VTVRQESRDPPLVHPRDGIDVDARLSLSGCPVVPRSELETPSVVPGPQYQDVALAELDALGQFLLADCAPPLVGSRLGET
jgi:hypothetical protein